MEVYSQLGAQAAVAIVAHVFFIGVTFYALQAFRMDQLFQKGKVFQIQLIYILLSMAIGSTVADFILSLSNYSQQLPYIFQ